jgi:putative ABC transport system permease protein
MPKLRASALRFVGLFRSRRADADFAAELESSVAMHTDDLIRTGLTPAEARRQALIHLGGAEQARQAHRERATLPGLESMLQDAHFSLRMMAHNPGFTAVAVVTLAIGIGATSAIFSVVKPILIDPLPYPHASRLMLLWEMQKNSVPIPVSFGTFRGLSTQTSSVESLAVSKPWQPAILPATQTERPERLDGQRVSADYFRTLGTSPILGRDFVPFDDSFRGPNVAILSDRLWRRRFAADTAILGREVRLDGNLYTVIGVMPGTFENVLAPSAELWAPLQYNPSLPSDGREWGHHLRLVARLQSGVTVQRAQSELTSILHTFAPAYAKGYDSAGGVPDAIAVHPLQGELTQGVRPALLAVLGAVLLLLVIACVNVANLLLARAAQRRAEFAMRSALGAARSRLVRQLLTETLLLSMLGAALGVVVAEAGVRILLVFSPPGLPRLNAIHIDGTVFLFALILTTLVGTAVGFFVTVHATRRDLNTGMRQTSWQISGVHQGIRRALVVAEVSLSVVLLVSAGLLLRSMQRLLAVDPGFDASHLLTMQVQESDYRYDSDAAGLQFRQQALDRVRQLPGVVSAGFTSQLPLSGDQDVYGIQFEKDNNPRGDSAFRYAVTPGYIETMHIPLLRGRLLNDRDTAGAQVAVLITASLADRKFGGIDPVGQRVRVGPDVGRYDRPWATIVGVVGNVRQQSLAIGHADAFYISTAQWAWGDDVHSIVVRASGPVAPLATPVRESIWSVDRDLPIVRVASFSSLLDTSESQRHFVLVLFGAFALVALALASIGVYGVLSGSVVERTREMGVRAALGATRADLLALIMRQGMVTTSLGLAIGIFGALAAARALASMLFAISCFDGFTYLSAVALLLLVSGIASFIPALRAASTDTMKALRSE